MATLIIIQLSTARLKARDMKRIADITQMRAAVEMFLDDERHYPDSTDMLALASKYLTFVPRDPSLANECGTSFSGAVSGSRNCYGYAWLPAVNPNRYQIWAELEDANSALEKDLDFDTALWSGAGMNGGTEGCLATVTGDCVFDLGTP